MRGIAYEIFIAGPLMNITGLNEDFAGKKQKMRDFLEK